jgi:hypothetical protein
MSGSNLGTAGSKITLKMVKKSPLTNASQSNGAVTREAALNGSSPDYAMTFDLKDVADLTIAEFTLPDAPKLSNGTLALPQLACVDTNELVCRHIDLFSDRY